MSAKALTYDGCYGRQGVVTVDPGTCLFCDQTRDVLVVDSSENEYRSCRICLPCIKALFEEAAK